MFRIRLALVIGISLSFVLFLGTVLSWGSRKVTLYYDRSQAAYEAFDRYERLSQEAYRHFKQRVDLLLPDSTAASATDMARSRKRLFKAIEELRNSVLKETRAAVDAEDREGQSGEPERIASLTAFLETAMYRFDEVEQLRQAGRRDAAVARLSTIMKDDIDRKFQPLIDNAIDHERRQADRAGEKLSRLVRRLHWVAALATAFAATFSLIAGFVLFRDIRRPIEALLRGTDEIAAGNLGYRIPITGDHEFGHLAGHFNQMAGELELQQETLREAQLVLEQKVAERTHELDKLNRELQRLDHARRELFADISHELRTPLTVIRGEAEVTLRGGNRDVGEYRDALQRVLDLATQLSTLVNDLLQLARAETTGLPFEWEVLDLTRLLAEASEDLAVLASEKSLAVAVQAPDKPIWVRGDRHRLRQVLLILGDNACRYSDPGGHIELVLHNDDTHAEIRVEDQGIGIPAQDLPKVFQRYFRSTNARRSGTDGTGLGLPLARSIVQAHDGEISVRSIEGTGTAFTVRLPCVPARQGPQD